jgi:UDP-N-acetylmuramate dehydrogenase
MKFKENVSLRDYSTMRLGGAARYLSEAKTKEEIAEQYLWAHEHHLPVIVIGGGSNIIWSDNGFDGLVIVNKISGFQVKKLDDTFALFELGAGEDWDAVVEKTVKKGYSGIEQLSYIPGTVGGTPVQNVGAYGGEIKDVLVSVQAFDTTTHEHVSIANKDCNFSYRDSRFKTTEKNRFLITSITLKLSRTNPSPPFYESVQKYLDERKISNYSPAIIREAVIAVRTQKLPDPDVVANNGSFFGNPIIRHKQFSGLQKQFPDIVSWPVSGDNVKLSAAWLIEHAGFKDYHDEATGMATWNKQPLVLINENAKSTQDLLDFRDKITTGVHEKFGVRLIQEPELL